jgi:two-component system response regulator AtoC
MPASILLVDDDLAILKSLGALLERSGYEVGRASDGHEGLELHEAHGHDVVLLDLELPDLSGIEVLERLRARDAAVILFTGHGDIETAVRAMQLGAEDFLTKPVDLPHLIVVIERALQSMRLRREVVRLKSLINHDLSPEGLGQSPQMKKVAHQAELIAASERTTVLLTGESGTGKGWLARLIHNLSPRADRPFIDINCGGLSANFLDSELFGHEKGAFTDAKEKKSGLFEVADGGTLFLDEIGELAIQLQPKLLRVLETKSFRRLGGTTEKKVDVRLISATNRDLETAQDDGSFREDLFYRVSVTSIHLPSLRQRTREDRLALLEGFLASLSKEIGGAVPNISTDALERLLEYDWPGNCREMRNALERMLIMARGRKVGVEHLPVELQGRRSSGRYRFDGLSLEQIEKQHIQHTLKCRDGNRTRTAKDLGITRATLINKIKKFELGT